MTEGHGKPIEGTDAETLKARANAIAKMTETVASTDAEGKDWCMVVNEEYIQMLCDETQVPIMCAALMNTLVKLVERIKNPLILVETIFAIDSMFSKLTDAVNEKKAEATTTATSALGPDAEKIVREVQQFLDKMENENENGNSDVSGTGSS